MKRILVEAVILTCFLWFVKIPSGACENKEFNFDFQQVIKDPVSGISISNTNGKIKVEPASEKDTKDIQVYVNKRVNAPDRGKASEIESSVKTLIIVKNSKLEIETLYPEKEENQKQSFKMVKDRTEVDYIVKAPLNVDVKVFAVTGNVVVGERDAEVDIVTTTADIDLKLLKKNAAVKTTSGDVKVGNSLGQLKIKTTSGETDIRNFSGDLNISAISGDCQIEKAKGGITISSISSNVNLSDTQGSAKLKTKSGNIKVSNHSGEFSASTMDGDIDCKLDLPCGKSVDMNSVSGSLSLELQGRPCWKFNVETLSGEMTIKKDVKLEKISRKKITGSTGAAPSSLISLKTISGDIEVK